MIYSIAHKLNNDTSLEKSSDNDQIMSLSISEFEKFEDMLDNYISNNDEFITVSEMENVNEMFSLYIPKAYAREEKSSKYYNVSREDVTKVPHYELIVNKQIGTSRNRRDTDIYYKLPKSGHLVRIILHMNQGVSFDKKFHTMLLHETDAIDRLIILGFCMKYQSTLKDACYEENNREGTRRWLRMYAYSYHKGLMPKRLKQGDQGVDSSRFWKDLKPYEESNNIDCGIFSNVVFI